MYRIVITMKKPKNKTAKQIADTINGLLSQFTNTQSVVVIKEEKKDAGKNI